MNKTLKVYETFEHESHASCGAHYDLVLQYSFSSWYVLPCFAWMQRWLIICIDYALKWFTVIQKLILECFAQYS